MVALGAPDRLVEAVDEQHAVREAGQRVVERVVLKAVLGLAAVGDVGDAADDPGGLGVVADRDPAREVPAVGAVAVLHAVLELEVLGGLVVHVRVQRLRERRAVVGVDAPEPLAAGRADLVLAVAEHALPARGVEDRVVGDVPVPEAVVGAGHRERVALLGLGELLQRALVRERVADRVLEPVSRQSGDDQEVRDPVLRRFGVGGAVGPVAEDDHGDVRRRLHQFLGQVQAVRAGRVDLAVDQDDVVTVVLERVQRLLRRRHVLEPRALQEGADGSVTRVVGRHREHAERIGEGLCRGHYSSAVSSQ